MMAASLESPTCGSLPVRHWSPFGGVLFNGGNIGAQITTYTIFGGGGGGGPGYKYSRMDPKTPFLIIKAQTLNYNGPPNPFLILKAPYISSTLGPFLRNP